MATRASGPAAAALGHASIAGRPASIGALSRQTATGREPATCSALLERLSLSDATGFASRRPAPRGAALDSLRARAGSSSSSSTSAAAPSPPAPHAPARFRLHNLSPHPGSRRSRRRVGRGHSAGQGGSSGRGMKGQRARSGGGIPYGFEGGQTPLHRRVPKLRGSTGSMPKSSRSHAVVSVASLAAAFPRGGEVDASTVQAASLAPKSGKASRLPLKVLATDVPRRHGREEGGPPAAVPSVPKLVVRADAFSEAAMRAIEEAGGEAIVVQARLPPLPQPKRGTGVAKERRRAARAAALEQDWLERVLRLEGEEEWGGNGDEDADEVQGARGEEEDEGEEAEEGRMWRE